MIGCRKFDYNFSLLLLKNFCQISKAFKVGTSWLKALDITETLILSEIFKPLLCNNLISYITISPGLELT